MRLKVGGRARWHDQLLFTLAFNCMPSFQAAAQQGRQAGWRSNHGEVVSPIPTGHNLIARDPQELAQLLLPWLSAAQQGQEVSPW